MGEQENSLVELRILEGPNLYFPRAAVKLTVDITRLAEAPAETMTALARRIGLANARPGEPGTGFRQRFALRALATLVRAIAREAGTSRLAVRVRPTGDPVRVVIAFPWVRRGRAEAMGRAVGALVDALPREPGVEPGVATLVDAAATAVREAAPGARPTTITPRVPVVAVTGTNGKTTTSRMIAHIARAAGFTAGWSSTDGIYVAGVLVEAGDYSGPSGAGRVLAHPEVNFAVTETARGGILLKGIGVTRNDVSVVTNVSADHLGLQGIDTLDQLAEVKSVVPRITRRNGWAVLNADDPRVLAMRAIIRAQSWVFSRDPDSPGIREVLASGGRATTVIDGWMCTWESGADPVPLVPLTEVPMTLAGLSRFNVENALAAASAALAAGIGRDQVIAGLRDFAPGVAHNPGRMNIYSLPLDAGSCTVVVDLAHNEAGLDALLEIMDGLRGPSARTLLGLGAVGDRQDDLLEKLGEIAGRDADLVAIGHKAKYLRGRTLEGLEGHLRAGLERVGMREVTAYATEVESLAALAAAARDQDVIGLMCHAQAEEVRAWLADRGATADSPPTLAEKVRSAHAG